MRRIELLGEVRDSLFKAGFYVSELFSMRPISFDLIARRDNSLLIIKVLTNIDSMSEDIASELKKLSTLLRGSPLIIGERSGAGLLTEDVVYDRFGIYAINLETLHTFFKDGLQPEVYAGPGGFYVTLDHEKLKKLRNEKKLSIGSFARSLKVSRRTVQMYEDGMNASVEVAIRIEDVLERNITVPIDIFKHKIPKKDREPVIKENKNYRIFQKEIFQMLERLGYEVTPLKRAPFEAVSQEKKEILLTCVDEYNKRFFKKAHIINSISKITEKYAVLITNKEINKKSIKGTPLIVKKELQKTRGPEELLDLLLERL
jgi:putative transcriptional regulator